jgi:hypothetical protein
MATRLLLFISPLALLGLVFLLVPKQDTGALDFGQVREVAEGEMDGEEDGNADRDDLPDPLHYFRGMNTAGRQQQTPEVILSKSFDLRSSSLLATSGKPSVTKPSSTKPSTTKPSKTKPSVTKPTKTKPSVTKPTKTKPTVTKPTKTKPTVTKPTKTKPTVTKPTKTKPTVTKPTVTKPTKTKPTVTKPTVTKPTITKPTVTKPTVTKPTITKPTITKPTITKPTITKPTITKPTITKPTITKPTITKPTITKPTITKPTITKPTITKPTITKPTITKPTITKPTITKPTITKPTLTKPWLTKPWTTKPWTTKPAQTKPWWTKPHIPRPVIIVRPIGIGAIRPFGVVPGSDELVPVAPDFPYDPGFMDDPMAVEPVNKYYERYLQVRNATDKDLTVFLRFRTKVDGNWVWVPAPPDSEVTPMAFPVKAGQTTYVPIDDEGTPLQASRMRIWATAEDGTEFTANRDQDVWLVPEVDARNQHYYYARRMGTFTHTFGEVQPEGAK